MAKKKIVNSRFSRHLLVGMRPVDDQNLQELKTRRQIMTDADAIREALRLALESTAHQLTDPPAPYQPSQG